MLCCAAYPRPALAGVFSCPAVPSAPLWSGALQADSALQHAAQLGLFLLQSCVPRAVCYRVLATAKQANEAVQLASW
jgi:hypothetical protein